MTFTMREEMFFDHCNMFSKEHKVCLEETSLVFNDFVTEVICSHACKRCTCLWKTIF